MKLKKVVRRLKATACRQLGMVPPGRNISVRKDDVFLVSYPRSGNTWVRFLLGNLVHGQPITFANVEQAIPDIYQVPQRILDKLASPRILKSHESFTAHYPRTIYLVRDARDVALSYFHYKKKAEWARFNLSWDDYLDRFLEGGLDPFGTWGGHVESWLNGAEDSPGMLCIRYEDLLEDTESALTRIATFLGIGCKAHQVRRAVEAAGFSNMRRLEQTTGHLWATLENTDQSSPFIRRGEAGAWRRDLAPYDSQRITARWCRTLEKLGY